MSAPLLPELRWITHLASMQRELVSVIMPAHNARETVAYAVRSALGQTWPDIEVIVVDDASTDDTWEVLNSVRDPRIRLLRNDHNLGEGLARNAAVAAARGEWVAMLDADDAWEAQRLERLLDLGRTQPGPLVLADNLMHCYTVEGGLRAWKPQWDRSQIRFTGGAALLDLAGYLRLSHLLLKPVMSRRFLLEKKLLHSSRIYAADTEFLIRVLKSGPRLLIAEEPLYLYRKTPGSVSNNPQRATLMREMFLELLRELDFTDEERSAIQRRIAALEREERYVPFLFDLKAGNWVMAVRRAARDPRLIGEFCRRLPQSVWYRIRVGLHQGRTR